MQKALFKILFVFFCVNVALHVHVFKLEKKNTLSERFHKSSDFRRHLLLSLFFLCINHNLKKNDRSNAVAPDYLINKEKQ